MPVARASILIPLHIVQRGHNRQPCFFGEEVYPTYLYWLGEALKKISVRYTRWATESSCVAHLAWHPAITQAVL